MQNLEKFLTKYPFLAIFLLSLPAIVALFVPGFYGASDDLHIAWLYEMDKTIMLGQIPPRFVPDLSFGFGYPLFNFVFPLPFYLGEIFHLLGFSFVDSIKAVFLVSLPLSGYFMYKFLKEHASFWISLAGAVVYIYTPYRATDIYVRGAIGEAFAFIFPPLIAWAVTKANVGVLGLGIAGLILSHNITAYMFVPFLAIFALFNRKSLLKSLYGLALGLLVSVYFWLPAILESSLMKYDTVFNFVDHFPTIRQLFTPHFGYGASVAGPYDGMSFFMGVVNILLILTAIVLFKKIKGMTVWAFMMIAVSIFMMNYRSTFLWENLPFLPYFQFPWRFLSLTTFATAILIISLDKFKFSRHVAILILVGVIALNFSYFKPQDFLGRKDDYFINRYIPVPEASEEYLKTGEEYLRLPKDTEERPKITSPDLGLGNTFEVEIDKDGLFDYYKYYFPGWEVRIDGRKVTSYPGTPFGQIQFKVPAGRHVINISFKETPLRNVLNWVSLLSLIVAVTIVFRSKNK
jgi:hypothetical protein